MRQPEKPELGHGLAEPPYRELVQHSPDALVLLDAQGGCRYVSPAFQTVIGRSADVLVCPDAFTLVHPDDREQARRAFAEVLAHPDAIARFQGRLRHVSGNPVEVEAVARNLLGDAAVHGILVSLRDVSRRNSEERAQRQAQTHDMMGRLAGGVAHDFNNLLTTVLGYASLAGLNAAPDSTLHGYLTAIEEASRRAADLCQQLLAYAGRARFVFQAVELSALVREMARSLQGSLPPSALLRLELGEGLPLIRADVGQLRTVVTRLVRNAGEALGEEPGSITIRTGWLDPDSTLPGSGEGGEPLPAGPGVVLEVEDTGSGMDEATRARIFEPFFSTRFVGRGLGLASILGIARAHGGTVTVTSAPGLGSTFRVYLPAAVTNEIVTSRREKVSLPGQGPILVVEDEPAIRDMIRLVLSEAGFEVLLAGSGEEGQRLARDQRERVRAVVLDVTMPGMGGLDLLDELRREGLQMPVLLMSGYSDQDWRERCRGREPVTFLAKPFTASQLVAAIAGMAGGPVP